MTKMMLSVADAAERLSLSRSTLYQEIAAGRLKAVRVGRARRVAVTELEAYVERLREESEVS